MPSTNVIVGSVAVIALVGLAIALGVYFGTHSSGGASGFYFSAGDFSGSGAQLRLQVQGSAVTYEILSQPAGGGWSIDHVQYTSDAGFKALQRTSKNSGAWTLTAAMTQSQLQSAGVQLDGSFGNIKYDNITGLSSGSFTFSFIDADGVSRLHYAPFLLQNNALINFGGYSQAPVFSSSPSDFQPFTPDNQPAPAVPQFAARIAQLRDVVDKALAQAKDSKVAKLSTKIAHAGDGPAKMRTLDTAYTPDAGTVCNTLQDAHAAVMRYVYEGDHPDYFSDGGSPNKATLYPCPSGSASQFTNIQCSNYQLATDYWGYQDSAFTCTGYTSSRGAETWVVIAGSQNVANWINDLDAITSYWGWVYWGFPYYGWYNYGTGSSGTGDPWFGNSGSKGAYTQSFSSGNYLSVHSGFLYTFNVWQGASGLWSNVPGKNSGLSGPVTFIGHSLGGAVAAMFSWYWKINYPSIDVALYTEGEPAAFWEMPNVGGTGSIPHTRYINQADATSCDGYNQQDPVTEVTSALGYVFHGTITNSYNTWNHWGTADSGDCYGTTDFNHNNWGRSSHSGSGSTCVGVTAVVGYTTVGLHYGNVYQGSATYSTSNSQSSC